jgi:hypothetical protein
MQQRNLRTWRQSFLADHMRSVVADWTEILPAYEDTDGTGLRAHPELFFGHGEREQGQAYWIPQRVRPWLNRENAAAERDLAEAVLSATKPVLLLADSGAGKTIAALEL